MSDNEIPDLWPPDIAPELVRTPVSILRTQATALGRRMSNVLEGEVRTTPEGDNFYHDFYVVVPTFGGYRYRLLRVFHDIKLYPVNVVSGADRGKELQNEQEFMTWLRNVFASPDTQRLLGALKSQAVQGTPAA